MCYGIAYCTTDIRSSPWIKKNTPTAVAHKLALHTYTRFASQHPLMKCYDQFRKFFKVHNPTKQMITNQIIIIIIESFLKKKEPVIQKKAYGTIILRHQHISDIKASKYKLNRFY